MSSAGQTGEAAGLRLVRRLRLWPELAVAGGYIVLYLLLDWGSSFHALPGVGITPWNPPPGLSLVLLLLFGLRFAPLLFVAALVAEVLVRGIPAPLPGLISCVAPTIGYTFSAWLLRRKFNFDPELKTLRDLLLLMFVAAAATPLVAIAAVAPYLPTSLIDGQDFWVAVFRYALGDFVGIMVTTPLILRLRHSDPKVFATPEAFAQALITVLFLWVLFGLELEQEIDEFRYFYLLFLPLIWIALRQGLSGAALGCLVIQIGVVAATVLNEEDVPKAVDLQLLMLSLAVSGLITGAIVDERRAEELARRRLSDQLAHLARLSLSGEIASGLAHELNQPLAALVNYLRASITMLNRAETKPPPEATETLVKAESQALRAGEALRRLRDFLRRGEVKLSTLEARAVVANAVAIIAPYARNHDVAFHMHESLDGRHLIADRIQLTQILLNLFANAVEAIGHSGIPGGWVTVSALPDREGMVEIVVTDSGPGIGPEHVDRVFDSFFTTKSEGMGLGLAICQTLIQAQGGRLWYEPRQDQQPGAFHLALPASGGKYG